MLTKPSFLRTPKFWIWTGLFLGSFALSIYLDRTRSERNPASPSTNRSLGWSEDARARRLLLSGFLPENPSERVYVLIENSIIVSVQTTRPPMRDGVAWLETDSLIFPGLLDLHSHVKYNVLGLWDNARSQFLNRFEWRSAYPPYKRAVSERMRPIRGDAVCAAVRWAELKALVGGATAIQGIGGDSKCATQFGVRNLEITGDLGVPRARVRGMTDIVMPDMIRSVYRHKLEPAIRVKNLTYDQALAEMLEFTGVTSWVKKFVQSPQTLAQALELLVGGNFGVKASTEAEFQRVLPEIAKFLQEGEGPKDQNLNSKAQVVDGNPIWSKLKQNVVQKDLEAMKDWIFGKGETRGYLRLASRSEKQAYDFLSKGGVRTISSSVRRYLGMFEFSIRQSVQASYKDSNVLGVLAHLSEGRRNDSYNQMEWEFLKRFGMVGPGLTLIHGVGMNATQLREAAKEKVSIVWSPFSNLLLYGETLDVSAAKAAGVNVAFGADWTPTGGKNLMEELKIARRYLDFERISNISDRDLITMATTAGAKSIRLENHLGCLKKGCQADLLLVARPTSRSRTLQDPYSHLVRATEKEVNLVVVAGEPVFGDYLYLEMVAQARKERDPEIYEPSNPNCPRNKAFRMEAFPASPFDQATQNRYRSVSWIQKELRTLLGFAPDPLFVCEDLEYQTRLASYIEKELPLNRKNLEARRTQDRLQAGWSPLSGAFDEDSSEVDSID